MNSRRAGAARSLFTPTGPRLVLHEPEEFPRLAGLPLRLWVNGTLRQDRTGRSTSERSEPWSCFVDLEVVPVDNAMMGRPAAGVAGAFRHDGRLVPGKVRHLLPAWAAHQGPRLLRHRAARIRPP